ncbi:carboxypeptidase regulatory-like domain-containing protein, partial [bacterium]|nr:carboxypeptidase regulatory-like domain-containing protein [bacterium]
STNGSRFNPIERAHQAANLQNPIPTERAYAGYIFDAKNSEPLVGASVEINGNAVAQSREGDGHFSTKLNGQNGQVKARLTYPGYNSLDVTLGLNYEKNVFFLVPEGGLFVEVIDNANNPVLYANISLKSNKGFWSKKATADIRGRYFEPSPPDSPLTISAEYEGFDDAGQATKIVEPPFGEKVVLQLLRPYYTISGRVVERDTQKGIQDVLINAVEPNFVRSENATTNKDGYYKLENLIPGSYELSLRGGDDLFMPPEQQKRIVRVIDKSASNVNFELVHGYSVSGVVVDSNQTPVEGASVYLTPYPFKSNQYFLMEDQTATTDSQGEFVLYNLPPSHNKESRIAAVHKELGGGASEPFDPTE